MSWDGFWKGFCPAGRSSNAFPLKNVNVLRHLNETQFLRVMGFVVESLGVKCTFCHNPENCSLDEKEQKAREREMIRMVQALRAQGKTEQAEVVEKRFQMDWPDADIRLDSTRL